MALAVEAGGNGAAIIRQLKPDDNDYFVLKPMHSALSRRRCSCFYSTCGHGI